MALAERIAQFKDARTRRTANLRHGLYDRRMIGLLGDRRGAAARLGSYDVAVVIAANRSILGIAKVALHFWPHRRILRA
jgi:hypothetical protein